jgi:hypothetical protein
MKYEVVDYINFPHEDVFDTYLNHMDDVAEFLPDIKEIRVLERTEKGNKVKLVNQWVAQRDLPGFMKKFFDVKEMGWIDRAEWDISKNCVHYELEVPGLEKYVKIKGYNEITPDGDRTRMLISGEMQIEIEKHPAVPKLLGRGLRPKVEKFFIELIKPNLVDANRAMETYLEKKSKKKKKK